MCDWAAAQQQQQQQAVTLLREQGARSQEGVGRLAERLDGKPVVRRNGSVGH